MKNKSKITKAIAIGLFVVAFLLNVSLTFDSGNIQNADLSLGSLNVSLFQQAYACGGGGGTHPCNNQSHSICQYFLGMWYCDPMLFMTCKAP